MKLRRYSGYAAEVLSLGGESEEQARFRGEFVELLNGHHVRGIRVILARVLSLMQQLESINSALSALSPDEYWGDLPERGFHKTGWPIAKAKDAKSKHLSKIGKETLASLNQELKNFRWSPKFMCLCKGFIHHYDYNTCNDRELTKAMGIYHLIRDFDAGEISRYRKCVICSSWYFANRPKQEYCDSECRRFALTNSERFKQTRREYMRKRRQQEKELERSSRVGH